MRNSKKIMINLLFILCSKFSFSQVKIGNNPAIVNPKVILELESTNKGVLIPRIALTATNDMLPFSSLTTIEESLLVYNTATTGTGTTAVIPGFYYWNGGNWTLLGSSKNIYNVNGFLTGNREINQGTNSFTFSGTGNTILNSGNVGIRTTTPTEALEVNGNIRTNAVILNSDINLKKEIKSITSVLENLSQINAYSYYLKKDEQSSELQFGLLAQEVQKVYPNLVSKNGSFLGVNYIQLIPVLMKAVQELQVEVNFLKEQLKK